MDTIVEEILGSREIKSMLRLTIKKQLIEVCADLLQDVLSSDANSDELKLLFSHRILQISERFFCHNDEHSMKAQNVSIPDAPNNTPISKSNTSSETNFARSTSITTNEKSEAYNFVVSMNNVEQPSNNDGFVNVTGQHHPIQRELCIPFADPHLFVLSNVKH